MSIPRRILPFLIPVLVAGCVSTQLPRVPPVTTEATGLSLPGKVVSHELATSDVAKSKAFYGPVFGWTFEDIPGKPRDYTVVRKDGEFIGGMFEFLRDEGEDRSGEWIPMFSIPDIDSAAEGMTTAGASIISGPRDLPDRGRLLLATDPHGAVIMLLESNRGDPPDSKPGMNSWAWNELWTNNPDGALSFYDGLFNFDSEERDSTISEQYFLLSKDGATRGGIMKLPDDNVRPHWVPFIRVANIAETIDQATALGARVIGKPQKTAHGDLAALLLDPTRAPLVILEFQN